MFKTLIWMSFNKNIKMYIFYFSVFPNEAFYEVLYGHSMYETWNNLNNKYINFYLKISLKSYQIFSTIFYFYMD